MKTCGWIIATVLEVTSKEIEFRVDESECFQNIPKFADLLRHTLVIPQKARFWKSELRKGSKHPVTFNRTEEEIFFTEQKEYVLLISRYDSAPIRLVGTGSKEELYKLLGRSHVQASIRYCANIPFIKGSVTGTLAEIVAKLKRFYPGDLETYLTHEQTTWFIVAPDGERKETIMPLLPSMVR